MGAGIHDVGYFSGNGQFFLPFCLRFRARPCLARFLFSGSFRLSALPLSQGFFLAQFRCFFRRLYFGHLRQLVFEVFDAVSDIPDLVLAVSILNMTYVMTFDNVSQCRGQSRDGRRN